MNSKTQKFILFCFVGAISVFIDLSLLYIGVSILHWYLYIVATFSFSVSSINGYFLNRKLTFKDSSKVNFVQYLKFFLISAIGLGLTLILLYIFTHIFLFYYLYAKIITIVLVVFWNYFANTLWTFKKN